MIRPLPAFAPGHRAQRPSHPHACSREGRPASGFTLIEVLAAVFLMSVVIGIAVAFFINLSNSSKRATDSIRATLRAITVLDRLSRDIETAALLVKPEEADPLSHPWYFTAESQFSTSGSDHLKFLSRSQTPQATVGHSSDLAQIAYFVTANDDGDSYTLYRWLVPGLPAQPMTEFPSPEDDRTFMVAEGLRSFGMRFLNEEGEWLDEWDSMLLVESGQLPIAVEIELAFHDGEEGSDDVGALDSDEDPNLYRRRLALPARPIDLQEMILAQLGAEAEGLEADVGDAGLADAGSAVNLDALYAACLQSAPQEFCDEKRRQLNAGEISLDELCAQSPELCAQAKEQAAQ